MTVNFKLIWCKFTVILIFGVMNNIIISYWHLLYRLLNYKLFPCLCEHVSAQNFEVAIFIYTTIGDACVFAKLDQFLPVRSHFDTKRPEIFFHIATFPSPTFGPLFSFHCPLFFTKNNNLQCRDVLKSNGDYPR